MKQLAITRFPGIPFVALSLAPSAAHPLQRPNGIGLPTNDGTTVQQIHGGWPCSGS